MSNNLLIHCDCGVVLASLEAIDSPEKFHRCGRFHFCPFEKKIDFNHPCFENCEYFSSTNKITFICPNCNSEILAVMPKGRIFIRIGDTRTGSDFLGKLGICLTGLIIKDIVFSKTITTIRLERMD